MLLDIYLPGKKEMELLRNINKAEVLLSTDDNKPGR
jgi:hypothetical protein